MLKVATGMATDELQKTADLLRKSDIKFVRLTFCDTAGITRAKALHLDVFDSWVTAGKGLCTAVECLPVMYDVPSEGSGITPIGEVRLIPKWDTLRLLPYSPGNASVFADMYDRPSKAVSPLCPRGYLQRAIDVAAEEGLIINASFENEFCLLRPTHDGTGFNLVDDTVYASTLSMDLNNEVIMDIVDALTKQGIVVEAYYPESCPGQHEIPIKYNLPMKAAEQQIIYKETVKAVAHKHGLVATFVPKYLESQAGNGCHLHFSLNDKNGKNLTPSETKPDEVSELMGHFIAGILEHLPAIMSMTTPTTNSLRRIVPGAWCGAYQCWGYENREAAVRIPFNGIGLPNPTNIELKTCDPTANPYLALASAIFAGMDGIKRKLPLPPNTDFDPGTVSEQLLKERNINILPRTVPDVIECLKKDKYILDCLQEPLAKALIAVRNAEYLAMKDMTFEEEVKTIMNRY